MATTEELQRHASEAEADGDAEHARQSAVTELRAALEDAESHWGLSTQTKDIKNAFEHVVVVEKDREKLTAAPPVKPTADMFTHEELTSWGYSAEEIYQI